MDSTTFLNGRVTLHAGDCLDVLQGFDADSFDACCTDPPYELKFMNRPWDATGVAFRPETWERVLRVLKPGAHLVAFCASKNAHRMFCAIEDGGFEIRDTIAWLYGSGFPKSLDVSKQLDAQERNGWLNVCKAVDNIDQWPIVRAWIEHSKHVTDAALRFLKSETETGTNTPKNVSALAPVLLQINPEKSNANAIIAELKSSGAHLTDAECSRSALSIVAEASTALSVLVNIAGRSPESQEVTRNIEGSSALQSVRAWLDESTATKLKAVEALKIWLGSKPFSNRVATAALCAALTDDLKLITLNRSEIFRALDTKSQMDFVSATTVTITESTAASLISFTVDTLRHKGIDRAAGAEREVVGEKRAGLARKARAGGEMAGGESSYEHLRRADITLPATDSARQWEGWGTALKPAHEPIVLARKPLSESTIAANVLKHGTGAINIDACRVATAEDTARAPSALHPGAIGYLRDDIPMLGGNGSPLGRWPANVIHDGSDEVVETFPETESGGGDKRGGCKFFMGGDSRSEPTNHEANIGSAARFFYSSKADSDDRIGSRHPTVKPLDLMQYLVRLVTPPRGRILDPFAGTGTTGEAAWREGFNAVLIEREAEYVADIERRMSLCLAGPDERARESIKARLKGKPEDHGPLFSEAFA